MPRRFAECWSTGATTRATSTCRAAGYTFLLAYAPSDLDTERVINVARKVGYDGAHKYDRFTITKL
jgi:hypothetical protein